MVETWLHRKPRPIKAFNSSWVCIRVFRLNKPYYHFKTPLHFVVEKLEWQHFSTIVYCNVKDAKFFWERWTKMPKLIVRDKEFITKTQEKELQLTEEENKNTPERPKFKVITGGGDFNDPNWLSQLPEETTFLAYDKNDPKQIDLEKYTLVLKYTKAAWLTLHLVDRDISPVYVDMLRFSLRKQHVETIEELE